MNARDISILIGNSLDRFDTSLYGFLVPILGPLFFPHYDPVVQLIYVYATSAVSLFSRPLGTFIFGMIARNHGPIKGLSYSLMGVAVTTVLIGFIPGYISIGCLAPLTLVCMRFMRGICAAGESTIAKLYIMEGKADHHAVHASYLYQSSSMLGIIIASSASAVVIGMYPAAWRVCFWAGGLTGIFALYMRLCVLEEKPERSAAVYSGYSFSHIGILWKHKNNIARVAIVTIFSHITYAVPFVFMNNFVPLITDISVQTMMIFNTFLLIFDMCAVPCIGFLTARYRAASVMICASTVLAVTIIPLFYHIQAASLWYVLCVRIWIVVWGVVFLCPLNFWCKSLFSGADQYFLVGMGNAIGVGLLGHVTTPICLWLWYMTGLSYAPAIYMAVVMGAAAWVVIGGRKL